MFLRDDCVMESSADDTGCVAFVDCAPGALAPDWIVEYKCMLVLLPSLDISYTCSACECPALLDFQDTKRLYKVYISDRTDS